MLVEELFQTIKDLEILSRLGWEVERVSRDKDALKIAFKTFTGKFWFRIDINPTKDKPFKLFFTHTSKYVETQTKKEVAAWLLSDFCTFYVLLLSQRVLEKILGRKPFCVPLNPYTKNNEFYLVADSDAIVTTYIIKRPDYNEGGVVTVQVPLSLKPEGFYAAITFNKGSETILRLNDTYLAVVRSLECAIALSEL
jgi:hypothetical protein